MVNEAELQLLCDNFSLACTDFGSIISLKSFVMTQGSDQLLDNQINGSCLTAKDKICYMGSTVTSSLDINAELDIHIGTTATTFGCLTGHVFSNSKLTVATKMAVYCTCILVVHDPWTKVTVVAWSRAWAVWMMDGYQKMGNMASRQILLSRLKYQSSKTLQRQRAGFLSIHKLGENYIKTCCLEKSIEHRCSVCRTIT